MSVTKKTYSLPGKKLERYWEVQGKRTVASIPIDWVLMNILVQENKCYPVVAFWNTQILHKIVGRAGIYEKRGEPDLTTI